MPWQELLREQGSANACPDGRDPALHFDLEVKYQLNRIQQLLHETKERKQRAEGAASSPGGRGAGGECRQPQAPGSPVGRPPLHVHVEHPQTPQGAFRAGGAAITPA